MTSDAALQVLALLLAADLRIKRDFWVDPIPTSSPFVVHLSSDLPEATLNALQAAVCTIDAATFEAARP